MANKRKRLTEEAAFQKEVIRIAKLYRWKVHHSRAVLVTEHGETRYKTGISGDEGYVDLTLAREGVVIHAELKSRTGRPTSDQLEWAKAIGPTYRLWRPDDLPEIAQLLSGGMMTVSPWQWFPSTSKLLKKRSK